MKTKVRLWMSLVQSVLLYGAEVQFLGKGDLMKLERWQTKSLRHIARSPVHITRERSDALRLRLGMNTVASTIQVRRIKWEQKWIARGFRRDVEGEVIVGDGGSDALRYAVFGRFSFEPSAPGETRRSELLLQDMRDLVWKVESATQPQAGGGPGQSGVGRPCLGSQVWDQSAG